MGVGVGAGNDSAAASLAIAGSASRGAIGGLADAMTGASLAPRTGARAMGSVQTSAAIATAPNRNPAPAHITPSLKWPIGRSLILRRRPASPS